jgi:uncharacterized integral membrane protein
MTEPEFPDQPTQPVEREPAVVPAPSTTPATPEKSVTQKAQDTAVNAYRIGRMIVLIVLGFIVALFVVRNWDDVEFDFVIGDASIPLALVMLIFTAIGIVLGMLLLWFLRRKR